MGKRHYKQNHLTQGDKGLISTELQESDDLLPSAEELKKYQELDPDFIGWVKSRCDTEQKGRIDFSKSKVALANTHGKHLFNLEVISMIFSFFVLAGFSVMSFILIREGHSVWGSIFGGTASIVLLKRIFSRKRNIKDDDE